HSPPADTEKPTGSITSHTDGSSTNNPGFTITADASDNAGGSGVGKVEFYVHYDGGFNLVCTDTDAPYACDWDGSSIKDQQLIFTIHVFDNAGNRAVDPGGYRHVTLDRTPPTLPGTATSEGSESGVWQNRVRQPTFTWEAAEDSLSGVQGYLVYWGTNPAGTSSTLQTGTSFDAPAPVASENGDATFYLRIAARDTLGNTSAWRTVYTFHYDGSAPTGRSQMNHGWGIAHSVAMPIGLFAGDRGSGVREVRLSSDGTTWNDWLPIQANIWWQVTGQHGDSATVAVQYRDQAGNASPIYYHPDFPASQHYRLQSHVNAIDGGVRQSQRYQVQDTLGQRIAGGEYARSTRYQLAGGYWPRIGTSVPPFKLDFYPPRPSSERYVLSANVVAIGGTAGSSERYALNATSGQVLASGDCAQSEAYQASLGYWSMSDLAPTPTSTPTPTATREPDEPPADQTVTPTATGGPPDPSPTPTATVSVDPGTEEHQVYLPLIMR
ncbi:MAG: hypothetical protein HC884_14150, partial [Chloroflexaceae bacterium]|nr:hypothetical protein [Chloroflexaceae bacterium]